MEELFVKIKLMFPLELKPREGFKNVECRFNGTVTDNVLNNAKKMGLNDDFAFFYKKTDGIQASWDYDLDENLLGRMRILKIESVLKSWEDYFYAESSDIRIKHFRPVDFFADEACVGLVLDGSGDQTMYYHDQGDSELFSLDIDFKSYFELAIDAKIMVGWQRYLVNRINPRNYTIDFPEKMEKLFPDFDLEAFTAKFESMRLSKR